MHKCTLAYDLMFVKYIITADLYRFSGFLPMARFISQVSFNSKKEKTSYFSMKMGELLQNLCDVALLDFCFPTNQQ